MRKKIKHITLRLSRRQLILCIVCALVVMGLIIRMFLFHGDKNQTRVTMTTNDIEITHFTDGASAAFLSSDNIPDVNDNRTLSGIRPLEIFYRWESGDYNDVFRANLNDQDIANGIKITPFVRGKWVMSGPDAMAFVPEQNWPADTKFTITIGKSLFNTNVVPNTRTITVRTPDIVAKLESLNIYADATSPKNMIGVGIISFNYPIDTTDFANKVSLKLDGKQIEFKVKFDRFRRTAFIVSAPIKITDDAQVLRMKLNQVSIAGGNAKTKKITAHTTIESADNIFKISQIETTIADTVDGNAQQLLLVDTTTAAAKNTNWDNYITAYLLPQHSAEEEDSDAPHEWTNDEITPEVLDKSQKIALKPINFATTAGVYQYAFSYIVPGENAQYIYITVKSGIESVGGFKLKNGLSRIMPVPYPEKSVEIVGKGTLLSLAGDKKIELIARGGVSSAHINLYKIKGSEINHLISQTYDIFAKNIEFKSWSFNADDIAVVFHKTLSFTDTSKNITNYTSLDLGEYLNRTGTDKTGIFIIQTATTADAVEFSDRRLILLTDIGIIRKVNLDDTSAVFLASLSSGKPLSDTEVFVLGRNGNSIWAGRTDDDGHVDIPKFAWSEYQNARQPVAIVARKDNDVSFIPYNINTDTHVEYSKFDIDGTYTSNTTPLNAYVFSDRGIYRPGDGAIIAGIIKNKSFKSLTGIPVKLEIHNSRGRTVLEQVFSLDSYGMFDVHYTIPLTATLGDYTVNVFSLNAKNKPQDIIGTTTFRVAEFMPDTMKISAQIANENDTGWILTNDITANISLQNLFGTPAANRRITINAVLRPIVFSFPQYRDYIFTPNFVSGTGMSENAVVRAQTFSTDIDNITTDENGNANAKIEFAQTVPSGTYVLNMTIRGFDSGDSNSVQTAIATRTSDTEYVVGYRASTDLAYINRDAKQSVNLIAIDHNAKQISVSNLTLRLVKRENLTSLIKDANGYYKYQTITRDKVISQNKFEISDTGTDVTLDTADGGKYFLQVLDKQEKIMANIEYFVASSDNDVLHTDTQAEMQLKLNHATYMPGDTISMNIIAPYAGAGLITIERDKVYAYKWFTTDGTASIQTIKIPQKFTGTGYVNVSFVRDINSRDIFTTPYAYAVAPFAIDTSEHRVNIKLDVPEKTDNNKLTIKYTTDKDAHLMIFTVNTGILQVAKYALPNPLEYFFKKSALQVNTFQTLSLLLPEYKILREFAKTGGSDFEFVMGAETNSVLTNPFSRKTERAVAFYSEIIDAKANKTGTLTFDIPESFNGSVTTFAVADNAMAMGSASTTTHIQSPIIVSASLPLATAPGDKFDVNATITNLIPSDTNSDKISISANTTGGFVLGGKKSATLEIAKNTDKLIKLPIQADEKLGASELNLQATARDTDGKIIAERTAIGTTSVRPITTFTTNIRTELITSKSETIHNNTFDMYPEFGGTTLYISANADATMLPLFRYLKDYDFTCSEQLVSRALPYALMPKNKLLGIKFDDATKQIANTINILQNRQNDDGSFDLWTGGTRGRENGSDSDTAYLTAYITEFLTIAKKNGFNIPREMLSRAIDYLRTYAGGTITNASDAAADAYAIYVITLNGFVPTGYIDIFEEYASQNIRGWESKLMGAYIATTYKMLKKNDKANDLIAKYKPSDNSRFVYNSMFDNNVSNDARYIYLVTHYFDMSADALTDSMHAYINSGNYSAYTSAAVIMGLTGRDTTNVQADNISIKANGNAVKGKIESGTFIAELTSDITKLKVKCEKCTKNTPMIYTIAQHGFPRTPHEESNGIEIIREYYDTAGRRITSANIGDIVTVKIFARATGQSDYIQNAVIADLLPGGFVANADTINGETDFYEFREDRAIFYTDVSRNTREITYNAQVTIAGKFAVPPIHIESMYNPQIKATGPTAKFTVYDADNK